MEPSVAPIQPDPAWIVGKHALMNVRATSRRGRTEIDPLRWRIPFQWQGCHYQDHDDQPFMLLVNSGGGFVEGDVSHFHALLEPGTRALFTTTASSKFYKCPGGGISREIVDLHVGEEALLEFCPDEAIPFARSRVHRINRIDMAPTARLFATDMVSAGRVHYGAGEVFRFDHLVSEFRITIGGRLVALDRLVATRPETIAALERLWLGRLHMATAFAYAPDLAPGVEDDVHEAIDGVDGTEAGVTRIGQLVIVRILSHETWQAHEALFNACARIFEFAVGIMLVLFGADLLRRLIVARVHVHIHRHGDGTTHFHAHSHAGEADHTSSRHDHMHARGLPARALAVGLMHGLAGSAALILLTVGQIDSFFWALAYLALFGIGSMIGMAARSVAIAIPLQRVARSLSWAHNALGAAIALGTIGLGAWVSYRIGVVEGLTLTGLAS